MENQEANAEASEVMAQNEDIVAASPSAGNPWARFGRGCLRWGGYLVDWGMLALVVLSVWAGVAELTDPYPDCHCEDLPGDPLPISMAFFGFVWLLDGLPESWNILAFTLLACIPLAEVVLLAWRYHRLLRRPRFGLFFRMVYALAFAPIAPFLFFFGYLLLSVTSHFCGLPIPHIDDLNPWHLRLLAGGVFLAVGAIPLLYGRPLRRSPLTWVFVAMAFGGFDVLTNILYLFKD